MAKGMAPKGGKTSSGQPKGQQPTSPNGGKAVAKGGKKGGKR